MWECRKCHEKHEDSFEVCWNCGTSKDGLEDPTFHRVDEIDPIAVSGKPIAMVSESYFLGLRTRDADEDEFPVCPYCETVLAEIIRREIPQDAFELFRKWIFFCPNCQKVLGVATTHV